jgi:hypothetical protein
MTTADPFAGTETSSGQVDDTYDPFGDENPEDAGSGGGPANAHSFPSIIDLTKAGGHLVILEPYDYNPRADNPNWKPGDDPSNRTREEFTCYLHVLSGGPIEVTVREQDKDGKWVTVEGKYRTLGAGEHPWPIHWSKVTIAQKVLVGQLKEKFDVKTMEQKGSGRWLGRLRFVAGSRSPQHLKKATPDALDAAYADAEKRGKAQGLGLALKIMNPSADDMAAARIYWSEVGKDVAAS